MQHAQVGSGFGEVTRDLQGAICAAIFHHDHLGGRRQVFYVIKDLPQCMGQAGFFIESWYDDGKKGGIQFYKFLSRMMKKVMITPNSIRLKKSRITHCFPENLVLEGRLIRERFICSAAGVVLIKGFCGPADNGTGISNGACCCSSAGCAMPYVAGLSNPGTGLSGSGVPALPASIFSCDVGSEANCDPVTG